MIYISNIKYIYQIYIKYQRCDWCRNTSSQIWVSTKSFLSLNGSKCQVEMEKVFCSLHMNYTSWSTDGRGKLTKSTFEGSFKHQASSMQENRHEFSETPPTDRPNFEIGNNFVWKFEIGKFEIVKPKKLSCIATKIFSVGKKSWNLFKAKRVSQEGAFNASVKFWNVYLFCARDNIFKLSHENLLV